MKKLLSAAAALMLAATIVAAGACAGGGGSSTDSRDPNAPVSHPVDAAVLENGKAVYLRNCAPCHGEAGHGDGPASATLNPKPRDHSNGEYMDALTDQKIADTIRMGGVISGYPNMPSSPHIRGDDMVALIAYVRTLSHDPSEITAIELKPES